MGSYWLYCAKCINVRASYFPEPEDRTITPRSICCITTQFNVKTLTFVTIRPPMM
jgi:hypothetical protein